MKLSRKTKFRTSGRSRPFCVPSAVEKKETKKRAQSREGPRSGRVGPKGKRKYLEWMGWEGSSPGDDTSAPVEGKTGQKLKRRSLTHCARKREKKRKRGRKCRSGFGESRQYVLDASHKEEPRERGSEGAGSKYRRALGRVVPPSVYAGPRERKNVGGKRKKNSKLKENRVAKRAWRGRLRVASGPTQTARGRKKKVRGFPQRWKPPTVPQDRRA